MLSAGRSCPNHAGLCRGTVALRDTWSSYNILVDKQVTHIRRHLSFPPLATLCPSGLQSTAYTWSDGNRSPLLAGGVTPASKHLSPTRQLTSSAWPGRSMASFLVLASQTLRVLSLLPLTSRRLSADQAIWYTAETWPLSDVRYLGTRTGC